MTDYSPDNIGDMFNFVLQQFSNVTFSSCSGVKKENVKPRKLKKYLSDNDTLFEKFGDNLVFRSVRCRRIIENEAGMDLCTNCKSWLLSKETNTKMNLPDIDEDDPYHEEVVEPLSLLPVSDNANVKVKYEDSDEDFVVGAKPARKSTKRSHDGSQRTAKRHKAKGVGSVGAPPLPSVKNEATEGGALAVMDAEDQGHAEGEDENAGPKHSSPAWGYFTPSQAEAETAVCNLCSAAISCGNRNTSGKR